MSPAVFSEANPECLTIERGAAMTDKILHIVMYPWFAFGHLTPFLHISNKLADRGHKISFLLPKKAILKLESFNLHPHLITFIPITVPHVDGLPLGSETTADIPFQLQQLLTRALDLTKPVVESHLLDLKPDLVFFDFACWLPTLARKLGAKSVHYYLISPATVGYLLRTEPKIHGRSLIETDLKQPPPGFPPSSIRLRAHEARGLAAVHVSPSGSGMSFMERQLTSLETCDAVSFKTCLEMEGSYCNYVESKFGKPVILAGPVMPEPPNSTLEEQFAQMLENFQDGTLVFCAFGSECVLQKGQFQELLLGLELTGLPFLATLRPPVGVETVESALPEGFEKRIEGRGFVYGGWVQQQLILKHPSVGCFVTHCGSGSLSEVMINKCQIVLLPNFGDQLINARLMGGDLKVGVEVEKDEESGLFTRDGVYRAVKAVMDDDSEVGKEVRSNHTKWREFLLREGLEKSYLDDFVNKLQSLVA
ncbi:hypothetical protein K2173_000762 [Erythroxylum novogranatense]|uniref:Glycosyltransferase n=1 Tax=Erythroxylum novogranatense TaxID=1862640 RepID=A0AAV8T3F1_9ROSI|nr:hypothetical protein K2173_000762 [Erythroxylum novogranatense]